MYVTKGTLCNACITTTSSNCQQSYGTLFSGSGVYIAVSSVTVCLGDNAFSMEKTHDTTLSHKHPTAEMVWDGSCSWLEEHQNHPSHPQGPHLLGNRHHTPPQEWPLLTFKKKTIWQNVSRVFRVVIVMIYTHTHVYNF